MGRIEASESENTNQDTIGDNAHKQETDRNNQDSEEDSIYNCLSLERGPKGLATYCKARKRKSSEKAETQRPVTTEGDTPAEKRTKLPCKVCAETTHPTLLGCPQLKKYIPSRQREARSLPEEVCKLCLGSIYRDCRHNSLRAYKEYLCPVSNRNFIICLICKKHEKAQQWFKGK